MRIIVLLIAFFGVVLAGQESKTITDDSGKLAVLAVESGPLECESNVYRWTGESFECLLIDRIRLLISHRNLNMRALIACQKKVEFLRAEKVLLALHQDARIKCQKLGKLFDQETAQCAGAIP